MFSLPVDILSSCRSTVHDKALALFTHFLVTTGPFLAFSYSYSLPLCVTTCRWTSAPDAFVVDKISNSIRFGFVSLLEGAEDQFDRQFDRRGLLPAGKQDWRVAQSRFLSTVSAMPQKG